MKLYRFSPIKKEEELLEAIKHVHFACFGLCKKVFGKHLPVAGNISVFCHYDEEYSFLLELRKKLTKESDNFNQKYFRLHDPINIPAHEDVPETTYTYLYVRRPDQYRGQVGDADFVLDDEKYAEFRKKLLNNPRINGVKIFDRPDLNMIELSDPDTDALVYVESSSCQISRNH